MIFRLHAFATRMLYRIVAPGHPRGWVDMHAVWEEATGDTLWVHTHGLARWDLLEIEFVAVPEDLRGYAHGLLFGLMGYMKSQKRINSGEHITGAFVSEQQRVAESATAREVRRDDDPHHPRMLRFVDYGAETDAGFPSRLFAAHIAALAEERRSPRDRELMFRRALEIYPPDLSSAKLEASFQANPGNWISLDGLGNALCDQGRIDEGMAFLKDVPAMCPAAATRTAEIVRDGVKEGVLPPPEIDERTAFWLSLDTDSLRAETEARMEYAK